MSKTAPYSWIVRFDVAPEWVADGFVFSDQRALEMLGADLSSACMSTELAAAVLAAPVRCVLLANKATVRTIPRLT